MADRAIISRGVKNNYRTINQYVQAVRFYGKWKPMTLVQTISAINHEIEVQFQNYNCGRGQLRYEAPSRVSLNAIRADGKPILIWQNEARLPYLLSQYVDQIPDCGGVTIDIDLYADRFEYKPLSNTEIKQAAAARAEQEKADEKQRKLEYRKALEQKTETYGRKLAEKVAEELLHNSIGYGHRDYCGMGLEYRDGIYYYGELLDGSMWKSFSQWEAKEDFIQWLALQSDASLARLEATEPFYWGNQTITRDRLEEFLM